MPSHFSRFSNFSSPSGNPVLIMRNHPKSQQEFFFTTIFTFAPCECSLGFVYIRAKTKAKAIFSFDLCRYCCRCNINTQIANNATGRNRRRFRCRSNINAPLRSIHTSVNVCVCVKLQHCVYELLRQTQRMGSIPTLCV